MDLVGYFSWVGSKGLFPQYTDMLPWIFTYNGYTYITAFVLFSHIAVCFYRRNKKFQSLLDTKSSRCTLILWLVYRGGLTAICPVLISLLFQFFAFLASFFVLIHQEKPNGLSPSCF